jgi:microcin C transport system permease protein
MLAYIIRRLFLIIPTLFGIMLINFVVIQAAPGGPVEQLIGQITGEGGDILERVTQSGTGEVVQQTAGEGAGQVGGASKYRGAQGLDPDFIAEIEKLYGFDKPAHERFFMMLSKYVVFDFGESYYRDEQVIDLVLDKMPVSISLGLWTTLLVYLISIPLGIAKAVRDGTRFDIWTSGAVIVGFAIPNFLFAILLVIIFAGGTYLDWFPLRGLVSENWSELAWPQKIADYFWHITLPIFAMVIGGFAALTMLTRAKGLTGGQVLYGHVFRNAMLIVIAGFPAAFISVLFGSSVLIEVIFSLDGLGLLGFEAVIGRDYPIMFASLYFFSLLGLVMQLAGDIMYTVIDPRIDFEARET